MVCPEVALSVAAPGFACCRQWLRAPQVWTFLDGWGLARPVLSLALGQPLLMDHRHRENYWVQSSVQALEIIRGLQSGKLPYESNKFPLGKKKKKKENTRDSNGGATTFCQCKVKLNPFELCSWNVPWGRCVYQKCAVGRGGVCKRALGGFPAVSLPQRNRAITNVARLPTSGLVFLWEWQVGFPSAE